MTDGMIFWLHPQDAATADPVVAGWARVAGGRVVQTGRDRDWRGATQNVALPDGEAAMLIVPVAATTLHVIACPGMTVRQGAAAAPLMAMEASIGPAERLHAVAASAADAERPHQVAVIAREAMDRLVALTEALGVPRAAIVPAALLLPPVEGEGFVAGRVGEEDVLRRPDCALSADEPLAPLLVGAHPVRTLSADQVDQALVAALAAPPLDLRAGLYARRKPISIDTGWVKRIGVLAGAAALCTLLIALVTIMRLHWEASALDARSVEMARKLVPGATDAADADRRLAAMLVERGGAGGFTGMTAAVMAAMQGTPGVRLSSLSRTADGSLRVQFAAPRAEDIAAVLAALQAGGWQVAPGAVQQRGTESLADATVMPS